MAQQRIDGATQRTALTLQADLVVVGSGPAGSAVAREAALAGARVVVVEAGRWLRPDEFALSAFDSMAGYYRAMGAQVVLGRAPMPYVQGKMVGGSSPINGAICWRLPQDVHSAWVAADPGLAQALPWPVLEALTDAIEQRLNVAPTDQAVAGAKNLLMARGAEAMGLEHRPIRRNVQGCEGLGRCLQGCPKGRKLSVDATLLADAEAAGALVLSATEIDGIEVERGRAVAVVGRSDGGARVRVVARRAVVVAASAIQSPVLLLQSGLTHGPVGQNLQCHPGVSLSGTFAEPVRMWQGATQGHEVIGLRDQGLKFEALGFDLAILASRLPGFGRPFARELAAMAHQLDWGVAVRAQARGRVRRWAGRTLVTYSPTAQDVAQFRKGLRVLGEMMLAAGARHVALGVRGAPVRTERVADLHAFERDGPTSPAAYTAAITHMFSTCKMGSDPRYSVVGPDFAHHAVRGLYIADSSVFPTHLGVNPQIAITAIATLCARRAVGRPLDAAWLTARAGHPLPLESTP